MANIYRPFPGDITRVHGIRVGQAQNAQAMTGVTVVLPQAEGAVGGVSVRGAAPGTRETDLLRPGNLVERAHAVVLSGGSAYGLAAADGVMRYLEQIRRRSCACRARRSTGSSRRTPNWPTGAAAWPKSSCAGTRSISPTSHGATRASSTSACCANTPNYCSASH